MDNEKLLKYLEEKIELKKQDKTELSNHKVDLASFEGEKEKFKLKAKKVFNEVDDVTAKYRDAVDEIRTAKKDVDIARKGLEDLIRKADKAKMAFKEVGIEPPSYLYEIDGVGFLAWENNLIDSKQILESYVKN